MSNKSKCQDQTRAEGAAQIFHCQVHRRACSHKQALCWETWPMCVSGSLHCGCGCVCVCDGSVFRLRWVNSVLDSAPAALGPEDAAQLRYFWWSFMISCNLGAGNEWKEAVKGWQPRPCWTDWLMLRIMLCVMWYKCSLAFMMADFVWAADVSPRQYHAAVFTLSTHFSSARSRRRRPSPSLMCTWCIWRTWGMKNAF